MNGNYYRKLARHKRANKPLDIDLRNGETNGNAVLKESEVIDIFTSEYSGVYMAKKYDVTRTCISYIRRRKCWGWLTKDLQTKENK